MEARNHESFVHIQKVLKTFQNTAMDSLRGPSQFSETWTAEKLSPSEEQEYRRRFEATMKDTIKIANLQTHHHKSGPFLIPKDPLSEKCESMLEGNRIACFKVGGEKRLCLPQVLQTVLRHFTMDHVQEVCTELHINLSRCNEEQLASLKSGGDLPNSAPSCGLITKTDAERLVNKLLHSHPEEYQETITPNSFKVYHECFGKNKGIIIPELYVSPDARCIKCTDCKGLFSTEKFVGHAHKPQENRTCHWGFDPANWRAYLHLAKDQDHKESLQSFLEDLKCRYSKTYKRKECPSRDKGPDSKRARYYDIQTSTATGITSGVPRPSSPQQKLLNSILTEGKPNVEGLSALPAYLHKGPPRLLNPESVVPFDDQKRYERHFAPNVSLAPIPPKKKMAREYNAAEAFKEEDDDRAHHNHRRDSHSDTDSVKSETPGSCTVVGPLLDIFHQALDVDPTNTTGRQHLTKMFMQAARNTEDSIAGLSSAAREMRQRMTTGSERETEQLEKLVAMQSALESEAAKHREHQRQIACSYRAQLERRETEYAQMHGEMLRELHRLRDELRKIGKSVPDIAYDLELMGARPTLVSPPESPNTITSNAAAIKREHPPIKIKEEKV